MSRTTPLVRLADLRTSGEETGCSLTCPTMLRITLLGRFLTLASRRLRSFATPPTVDDLAATSLKAAVQPLRCAAGLTADEGGGEVAASKPRGRTPPKRRRGLLGRRIHAGGLTMWCANWVMRTSPSGLSTCPPKNCGEFGMEADRGWSRKGRIP